MNPYSGRNAPLLKNVRGGRAPVSTSGFPVVGNGLGGAPRRKPWSILSLFARGENGAAYEPFDPSTLFQERTGAAATTPSAVGGVAGTLLDLSGNGHHATADGDDNRALLQQDETGRYYLKFDGIDDFYTMPSSGSKQNFTLWVGIDAENAPYIFQSGAGTVTRLLVLLSPVSGLYSTQVNTAEGNQSTDRGLAKSLVIAEREGTTLRITSELDNASSTVTAPTTINHTVIGRRSAASGGYMFARIYALGLLDRALTAQERRNLKRYLADKTGVAL